jgi:hypothetical protein
MSAPAAEPVDRVPSLAYASPEPKRPSRLAFWIGWAISVVVAIMLGMGGVMDLLRPPFVLEGLARAGFKPEVAVPLGVTILLSVILFVIPRTAIFGAVLLTAYLGGAVVVHTQLQEYTLLIAPIVFAAVMWIGLVLRDRRFRALLSA